MLFTMGRTEIFVIALVVFLLVILPWGLWYLARRKERRCQRSRSSGRADASEKS